MSKRAHTLTPFGLLLCITFLYNSEVLAHKVRVFAWSEGGTINTESKFSGGKAARKAKIEVIEAESGKKLLEGTTDTNGYFSFPLPKTGAAALEIIVDSGDGHKNSWTHPLTIAQAEQAEIAVAEIPQNQPPTSLPITNSLTRAELSQLLDEALETKLAPIRRELAEKQENTPTLQDILGGIGYILGLAGIAAYFKSKNSKE